MLRTLCSLFCVPQGHWSLKAAIYGYYTMSFSRLWSINKKAYGERKRELEALKQLRYCLEEQFRCVWAIARASSLRQLPEHPARVECLPAGHMSERLILTEGKYFIQHDPVTPSKWRKRKWQISQSHNNVEMSVEQLTALLNHFNSTCPISSFKPNWFIPRVLLHGF